ncbi:MAG: phosphatidate cytidylyltransferase [Bacteroides sp.]
MNSLVQRTLSGAAFVAVTVGALYAGTVYTICLFAVYAFFSLREFYQLAWYQTKRPRFLVAIGLFAALLLYAGSVLLAYSSDEPQSSTYKTLALGSFVLAGVVIFFVGGSYVVLSGRTTPFLDWAKTLLGLFYVIFPFALIPQITKQGGEGTLFLLLVLTWTNDTGAYCVGRLLGRHKLIERVSPKKTVEGFIGGLIFSAIVGGLFSYSDSLYFGALLGIVVALASVLGDLVESRFKRSINIKDSGRFLPGHGGFLDRFDSLLFSLPAVVLLLFWL